MFEDLDAMEHLKVQTKSTGQRIVSGGRNDAVADLLAACQAPSQLAALARRFGLSLEEIRHKAEHASGFGQFRMAVGNRIRGIVKRIDRARRRGREMPLSEALAPHRRSRAPVGWRDSQPASPADAAKP